ncbi:MAG: DUF362 domain-containing protein [Acidobacteriota bacterium]|nr:DUF362 domain-containing protein [Acidobacteriota bacterium]MDW3229335.1 DUF362 domain-containing protein [Acidobacteriota bacterium]MDY0231817.1 DUF362 domain-containing protein [Candidatus Saccharicenans sp.]
MKKSKVVIITAGSVFKDNNRPEAGIILAMYKKGFKTLTGASQAEEALTHWFRTDETIGIKINTIGRRALSTRPETSLTLGLWLGQTLKQEENVILWDRTSEELQDAGYKLSTTGGSLKILATDSRNLGYLKEPTVNRNIGSLFSRIQAELISSSISLAILKDHGLAGVTAGMKNYFGAIHNPNKYHDYNCNPYVAELFEIDYIRKKHRLTILDALRVQYHRGPSYHPQWLADSRKLVFSTDPVAADAVGWKIIEDLRAEKGLPSLKEENRQPGYLFTAEKMNLGQAQLENIEIIEEEI